MKTSTFILTLLCTITLFSCQYEKTDEYVLGSDNANKNTISVHYLEEQHSPLDSLQIYFPTHNKGTLYIKGGDGNYTITPPNTKLLNVTLEQGNKLIIEPLESGKVEFLIKDGANNSHLLYIEMSYSTKNLTVTRTEIAIKGDGLTEQEKDAIKEKALKTFPVKVDGGYQFTYTKRRGGVVTIYPNSFGESDNSTEDYNFEYVGFEEVKETETTHFVININNSNRVFWYGEGELPTKSNYLLMVEDLTAMFKTDYPAVEKVFAQQQAIEIQKKNLQ